jgi:hypothetical protein
MRPVAKTSAPAKDEEDTIDLNMARQRTIDGTVLLFDRERILRQSSRGPEKPNQFSKRQWAEGFKLAFVESKVKTEAEAGRAPWFTYRVPGLKGILVPRDSNVRDTMRDHVVKNLSRALEEEADAIVFPEFALPPVDLSAVFPDIRDFNPFDPAHQAKVDREFEGSATSIRDEACAAANRKTSQVPFIFYGSMHCQRSRYNIGVVSPGRPFEQKYVLAAERGNPITSETSVIPEQVLRTGPVVHKKRFPARRVGEAARVPGGLGFRLYPSKIGCIAVLICSDAIDLNQFWYVVRHNQQADAINSADRIGLVVVPSYTHSDLLHTNCKDLSALAQTTVFVGNATGKLKTQNVLYEHSMPSSEIFQSGRDEGELSRSEIVQTTTKQGVRYYEFKPTSEVCRRDWSDFPPRRSAEG